MEAGKQELKLYVILVIVFLLSLIGAWLLPLNDLFKGIFATPAIVAMIGALFQLARDHAAHEKNLDLQLKQQIFNLGATSHMANVTFDKHVVFCEKYMTEVSNTVATLYREGTTKEALIHANNLYKLRLEFAAWLTQDIGIKLEPFEKSLRAIGAWQGFIENTTNVEAYAAQRAQKIDFVHQTFCKVLNIDYPEGTWGITEEPDEHISEEVVKQRIREILDIEDLVRLRKGLINEACSYIETHHRRV